MAKLISAKNLKWLVIGGAALGAGYLIYKQFFKPAVAPTPVVAGPRGEGVPGTIEDKLRVIAQQELGLTQEDVIVRSLIPNDLGVNTWTFVIAGGGWNGIVNQAIADNRFIALTGVSVPPVGAPPANVVTELEIASGGSTRERWNIQNTPYKSDDPTYHDPSPTIIKQNETAVINAWATGASAGETLAFRGVVAERRGLLLNP